MDDRSQALAWRVTGLLTIAILLLTPRPPLYAEPPASPPQMLPDATLRDITFIDADRGWAVGDRGVIWRTTDGGRHWQLQSSGVGCRLESIFFVDPQHGWIVGGWTHPYSNESRGVVLRTTDGGHQWTRVSGPTLPLLQRVRFFTPRDGIAFGATSDMYPSGLFRTMDGGRSWNALPPGPWQSLSAADFVDPQRGVVVDTGGQVVNILYGRAGPARTANLGARRVRDVKLAGDVGWLVGDGGLIMRSRDGGGTWQVLDQVVPPGGASLFDFYNVAVRGAHCWIAGSPGSVVFHSADGGNSWERLVTNQSLPIMSLSFLDEQRGWAVGELGMILATRDGGRTWWPLRSGGMRAALLGIFSEPESTPFEMYAWYSGNEGYLGVAHYVNFRESAAIDIGASDEQRAQQALTSVGGSTAHMSYNFPLRQEGLQPELAEIIEAWNRANDGNARDHLREMLVRQIRIWRPDILVTEPAGADGDGVAHEISQAVLAAVDRAADPTAYPEHSSLAALTAWRVKKVLSKQSRGSSTLRLNSAQLAANLGASLDEYCARARGLVFSTYVAPPEQWDFQLLVNTLPQDIGQMDFFSGLQLSHGGEARRQPATPLTMQLDQLGRLVQKRRNMERLISQSQTSGDHQAALVGQLNDLTRDFPAHSVAAVLYQLAMQYQKKGETELAAQALHRMVSTCPDQDLTDEALAWLVRHYASSEMAWRLRSGSRMQTMVVQTAAEQPPQDTASDQYPVKPALLRAAPSEAVTTLGTASPQLDAVERGGEALQLAAFAAQTRPTLFARPEIRFPMAAVQKRLGQAREAESYLQQLMSSASDLGWRATAEAELWLAHGQGTAPKPIANCYRTAARPHLDGELGDEVWQRARPLELHSTQRDDAAWPATAMFAFDEQFLFLALVCRRAPHDDYPASNTVRQRDQDLSQRDRVEFFLDMDRDYASYYALSVDHRGWANDVCCEDAHWNPKWFIASAADASSWTIEAAIPWSELTPQPPQHNDVWALGVQRVAPKSGFQSWTTPAAVHPLPQGFGLLIFQD